MTRAGLRTFKVLIFRFKKGEIMYINPFVAGILVIIGLELVALIVATVIKLKK